MPYHCRANFGPRACGAGAGRFGGAGVLGDIIAIIDNAQPSRPTANPHFDVYETSEEYVLEGELPGIKDKTSVTLQFSDAQTLNITGSICGSSNPRVEAEKRAEEAIYVSEKKRDGDMADAVPEPSSPVPPSYRASVEDSVDDDDVMSNNSDFEVIAPPTSDDTSKTLDEKSASPKETVTLTGKSNNISSSENEGHKADDKPTPKTCRRKNQKYLLAERSVGRFNRSFSFPGLVDQDSVKANLNNGLLTIHVPKRKPYIRKVQIE